MEIRAGQRLGPYEIVSQIGAGGMGEVFEARDTRLDRSVAIKILPPDFAHDSQLKIRFEREAKTISRLNHPNICTLHDVGQENGTDYLVMELLQGETLAARLEKGPLPISEVLKYGGQIADALDRAHRSGVTHRDLKPANIMLTRSGAKLLDFGLAKAGAIGLAVDGATQRKELTQEGTIIGTFQYMAPEQLEGLEADARTDIFSLGAVLYEMATGKRAFEGSTKTSLIAAIVSQDPKPIAQIQPLTPPAFEHVVAKCLAKDPDDRWQSAHDVAEELRWIAEAGSQAGVAAPLATRKRTRERLAWSAAAALLIVSAVLAWLYARTVTVQRPELITDLVPPKGVRFNAVGDECGPVVISPDGRYVVFSAADGPRTQLWLRSLATGQARPIAGTESGTFPFWSPDSRKIAFFASGQLQRVDIMGGASLPICSVASGPRGGTWSSDGSIIYTPDTQMGLYRVPAGGGSPVQLTTLDAKKHSSHRWPAVLPDGKHFLFLAADHQNPTGANNGIYIGSVGGKEPPRLVTAASSNGVYAGGFLLYDRGQTLFAQRMSENGVLEGEPQAIAENVLDDSGIWHGAFSVSRTGVLTFHTGAAAILSTLRWVDRSGKELGRIGDPGSYWDIDLSPDGKKLSIPIGDPLREVWIHDLQRNTRTKMAVEKAWSGGAIFSPDVSTVYLVVFRDGRFQLVAKRVTGGGERRLWSSVEGFFPRSISPDGKWLLAESNDNRGMRLSTEKDTPPLPIVEGKDQAFGAGYSPDGKWIAYASFQNGRPDVFVMSSTDPTQRWQISGSGGMMPRWRRDGKELYYLSSSNQVIASSIDSSAGDLAIGAPQVLFSFTPRPQTRSYDVAPDGRFLLNVIEGDISPVAAIMTGWQSRLKK